MSEMINRIIDAIDHKFRIGHSQDPLDDGYYIINLEEIVLLMITAIRNPTESMLIAGGADDDEIFHKADYAKAWQKMVDEMLK